MVSKRKRRLSSTLGITSKRRHTTPSKLCDEEINSVSMDHNTPKSPDCGASRNPASVAVKSSAECASRTPVTPKKSARGVPEKHLIESMSPAKAASVSPSTPKKSTLHVSEKNLIASMSPAKAALGSPTPRKSTRGVPEKHLIASMSPAKAASGISSPVASKNSHGLPRTPLQEARSCLLVSAIPDSLPCREEEFAQLYNFVEGKLMSNSGGCMYVSGVPGTGKTATAREVVRALRITEAANELPHFKYVEVNGMKLTAPQQVYVQMYYQLTGKKRGSEQAVLFLDKMFRNKTGSSDPVLLLVDELDLLWTKRQDVLYRLFDWPTRAHVCIVIIAIANTMDLPERVMMNRVSSRLGLTRLSFSPYTFRQLHLIVESRLRGFDAFEVDAIQLAARKVAAVSGDVRRALDICRRAAEIAEFGGEQVVGMKHIEAAVAEVFSSLHVSAIRNCSKMQQLWLRSISAEFQRSGVEEAIFRDVYKHWKVLCGLDGITSVGMTEAFLINSVLASSHLLLLETTKADIVQKIRLNVSADDITHAFKVMNDVMM